MSYTKRNYRTNLAMQALLFLNGKEVVCTITDLSTTGAKIEIRSGLFFKNAALFSEIINTNDLVNISVPEMHFDGEIKVIRKDILYNNIHLSVAFDNIFLGLKNLPYIRKVYRTNYRSTGQVEVDGMSFEFVTHNVSTKGILIAVFERINLHPEINLNIDLKPLNINAKARLIWSKKLYNKNLMGLEYTQLANPISGIASFEKNKLN